MKAVALIIAHNEERHIGECIESLLAQTEQLHEIVLINHNSIDRTGDIARTYPVRVIDYAGPRGSVYARIKGFESVDAEVILCIDGDAIAAPNFAESISALYKQPDLVMAGSWVRMRGTFYTFLSQWWWYFLCDRRGFPATDFLWGAGISIRGSMRERAIAILKKSVELTERLRLPYNPDDYWLALGLLNDGDLRTTRSTYVIAYAKETDSWQMVVRSYRAQWLVRAAMRRFLKQGGVAELA